MGLGVEESLVLGYQYPEGCYNAPKLISLIYLAVFRLYLPMEGSSKSEQKLITKGKKEQNMVS